MYCSRQWFKGIVLTTSVYIFLLYEAYDNYYSHKENENQRICNHRIPVSSYYESFLKFSMSFAVVSLVDVVSFSFSKVKTCSTKTICSMLFLLLTAFNSPFQLYIALERHYDKTNDMQRYARLCFNGAGSLSSLYHIIEYFVFLPYITYCHLAFDVKKTSLSMRDGMLIFAGGALVVAMASTTFLDDKAIKSIFGFLALAAIIIIISFVWPWAIHQPGQNEEIFATIEVLQGHATHSTLFRWSVGALAFSGLLRSSFFRMLSIDLDGESVFMIRMTAALVSKLIHIQVTIADQCTREDPLTSALRRESFSSERHRSFFRNCLHCIRQPLNVISLGLRLLPSVSHPSSSSIVNMAQDSVNYFQQTLQDASSMQAIESGQMDLKISEFNVRELIQSVVGSQKGFLTNNGTQVDVDIKLGTPENFHGDKSKIQHVLANFLSNAIKFSPNQSTIKIIVIIGEYLENWITFSVVDEGIGISDKDQEKLFKPYVQIDPSTNQKGMGTGIGLSICKEMIARHGGVIGCSSDRDRGDKGSRFFFHLALPIVDRPSSKITCAVEATRHRSEPMKMIKRALLVDGSMSHELYTYVSSTMNVS